MKRLTVFVLVLSGLLLLNSCNRYWNVYQGVEKQMEYTKRAPNNEEMIARLDTLIANMESLGVTHGYFEFPSPMTDTGKLYDDLKTLRRHIDDIRARYAGNFGPDYSREMDEVRDNLKSFVFYANMWVMINHPAFLWAFLIMLIPITRYAWNEWLLGR